MKKSNKLYQFLLYVTNNESKPVKEWRQDEIKFDIGFFIALVLSSIFGFVLIICAIIAYLQNNEKLAWCIMFLFWGVEYCLLSFITALDAIRHNREE
jgi:hypothetical protein